MKIIRFLFSFLLLWMLGCPLSGQVVNPGGPSVPTCELPGPSGLSVQTQTANSVTFGWNPVSGAAAYSVTLTGDDNSVVTFIVINPTATFTIVEGVEYTVTVTSLCVNNEIVGPVFLPGGSSSLIFPNIILIVVEIIVNNAPTLPEVLNLAYSRAYLPNNVAISTGFVFEKGKTYFYQFDVDIEGGNSNTLYGWIRYEGDPNKAKGGDRNSGWVAGVDPVGVYFEKMRHTLPLDANNGLFLSFDGNLTSPELILEAIGDGISNFKLLQAESQKGEDVNQHSADDESFPLLEPSITLGPNPCFQDVQVLFQEPPVAPFTAQVYDPLGRMIAERHFHPSKTNGLRVFRLDTQDWPNGNYAVLVTQNGRLLKSSMLVKTR